MVGMTPKEARIMDLWEQGLSAQRIAPLVGREVKRVVAIIGTYYDDGEATRERKAMIAASTKLARAIRQARPAA